MALLKANKGVIAQEGALVPIGTTLSDSGAIVKVWKCLKCGSVQKNLNDGECYECSGEKYENNK